MVEECLSRLPKKLLEVEICPPASVFAALPAALRERWRARAEAALAAPLTQITAADWLRFSRTGDRAAYETLYFSRRRRLTDLVCGALTDPAGPRPDGPWLDAILDTIWAICEESAWQLPAHNSYIRDAPQLPWPDTERPVVDLFAAETGELLACACAALDIVLPGPVQRRIFCEVERRVLTPYLTTHFWWMGSGNEPMCNWTPWCTQNLLLCAFGLPFSQKERRTAVEQAARSLDCFLKDYGPDGCCSEGAQYYGYAGLCLFGCLELLCAAVPGVFDRLWQEEKIKNIAAYIFHMHVDGPCYINFADCSPFAGRRGAREFLFALRTGNAAMASFAAHDWLEALSAGDENSGPDGGSARINLWYQLLEARAAGQMAAVAQGPPPPAPDDIYYPSVGVFVARRGGWCLAAKAGCNADSHNHNDTGSIILYRDGRPFLIDLGVETYTKKTFSPRRYEIWTMQSQWHNLPTFDGAQQKDGAAYRARDVHTAFGDDCAWIAMELSAAWPAQAKLRRFVRTVRLTDRGLLMENRCTGDYKEAFLSLLTMEKPLIAGSAAAIGELGTIFAQGAAGPLEVDVLPISDPRLRIAWPDTLYRLRVPFTKALTVEIK